MLVSEEAPHVEAHPHRSRRRHRHRRSFWRKMRRGWQRTRLRQTIFSLLLVLFAVAGGYKFTMYVIEHHLPSAEELNSGPKN
jgi:hypothetical protein